MFDINADNLSERLPYQKAERFRRLHEKWAELGIVTSYLAYMISNVKSHRSLLDALITASFIMNESKLARATKEIINISCNDIYKQALEEAPESVRSNKPKLLPISMITAISFLTAYGLSSEDYVKSYNLLNSQTAIQKTVSKLHTKINIRQFINDLTNKLSKVLLSISENNERTIYSGVIIEAVRMSGNNAYIEPFKDDDILVRFIAERDDRTTKMCKSLDDQLFRTNGMNVYKRYSDSAKKNITMRTYGLKSGENLPPIADHFHWCRSTVTYLIDNTTAEFIRSHHNGNLRYWISRKLDSILSSPYRDNHQTTKLNCYTGEEAKTEWLEKNKGTGIVEKQDYVVIDNQTYHTGDVLNGTDVLLDNVFGQEEIDVANMLANKYNIDVNLNPRIENPKNYKSPDYTINGVKYDLKTPRGSSENTIKGMMKQKQCNNFIVDLRLKTISVEDARNQILKIFSNPQKSFVDTIVLINDNEIDSVYIRT